MRSMPRVIQTIHASPAHSLRGTRTLAFRPAPGRTWTRPFHASVSLRVVDLAYKLHDDKGSADGDPIVMIHGLFGSKRNNQSVGK